MCKLARGAMRVAMASAIGLSATFANAETAVVSTSPASDLDLIRAKAATNPSLAQVLQQLENMRSNNEPTNRMVRQIMRDASENGDTLTKPFPYLIAVQVRVAQNRAQYISQILQADINNDGDVTKVELKSALPLSRNSEAAAAFFSSDTDENEILSAQEIRTAAEAWVGQQGRSEGGRNASFELFDFDADGVLTPEELDRGVAALGS